MPVVTSPKQEGGLVRSDDWQAPISADSFQAGLKARKSKGMRAVRRIAWNLLPPLTFVADGRLVVGRHRDLQDSGLPAAGSGRRLLAGRDRCADAVESLGGDADRDPAGLRFDRVDRNPARARHRALAAGEADRLSAVDAHAAGAEDRGCAALSRVAWLRDRIEGSADGADDVLSACCWPASAGSRFSTTGFCT